jgi:aminopeptidase N
MINKILVLFVFSLLVTTCKAQKETKNSGVAAPEKVTDAVLRGSIGAGRNWWDVSYYNLKFEPNMQTHAIKGEMKITFKLTEKYKDGAIMQLDLQQPMRIDSIKLNDKQGSTLPIKYYKQNNVWWVSGFNNLDENKNDIYIYYSGTPKTAKNAPWDGGFIWKKDANGNPFVSVACQELGASVWYPCKDHQSEEPELGAQMTIIHPKNIKAIGNGKLVDTQTYNDSLIATSWAVSYPINNYNFVFYLGNYYEIKKTYNGEAGMLNCSFWCLDYNKEKAEASFTDIFKTLSTFEKWFGPYPWYNDGYKLVEAPHLGMEHQSAIAYGNNYKKGYMGMDLSGSGHGKSWDYIIIHESGHEWWGNQVTTNDIADMWIHEGFTTFSEGLFVEEQFGKQAAEEYILGLRKNIGNKDPLISEYGINKQPNGDIYYKGANLIYMIRTIMNDDERFRRMLREIQKQHKSKPINSVDIERFINIYSGIDFSTLFEQYCYTNEVPSLKVSYKKGGQVVLEIKKCNENFSIPYRYPVDENNYKTIELKANKPVTINTNLSEKDFEAKMVKGYYLLE